MNTNESQDQQQKELVDPVRRLGSGLTGLAIASLVSGYILGPLLLFGGIGWWLTKHYHNRLFVIIGVAVAFVLSNVLIIRNTTGTLRYFKRINRR